MSTQASLRGFLLAWLLLAAALVGLACSEVLAGEGTAITTIDAGPHHRLLGVVESVTGDDGQAVAVTNTITVLATGLNRFDETISAWVPAQAEFERSADGDVIARRTQHQVTRCFVYPSTNGLDGFGQPLQAAGTTSATFVHTNAPSSALLYQVRAGRLIQTGAGSYWDLGQAAFVGVN